MKNENLNIIVSMRFGSHLYGTDTPDSDLDIKGVFMPSYEDILLNRVPKDINLDTNKSSEKNSAEDVDESYYSLHYFIELACKGETVAIDMLHANEKNIIESSPTWDRIVANRDLFYTKNLKSFVGYCRKQASKYGVKGSRLAVAKEVLGLLKDSENIVVNLSNIWSMLPEDKEHTFKHPADKAHNDLRMYEVCGRKMQETAKIPYAISIVEKFVEAYGERARKAEANEGIDWKAVSHAIRAAIQIRSILTEGTINFPLKEADFLKKVKAGELHYKDDVAPLLDDMISEVEELTKVSTLPEKVDRRFWDEFLIRAIEEEYLIEAERDMRFPWVK
jgi:hypothetical protein